MQYISGLAIDFAGASSYYAQFLAGWQVVTDSLHQIHPILLILAVIVLTLLAQGLIIFWLHVIDARSIIARSPLMCSNSSKSAANRKPSWLT